MNTIFQELIFKNGYNVTDDFESEMKGYRNDVFVKMKNGDLYEVFFYDSVRLTGDMGSGIYLSKPGLIVLDAVNKKSMEYAVKDLCEKNFFDYFKPQRSISQKHFDENI
jgi:hypothetical protein